MNNLLSCSSLPRKRRKVENYEVIVDRPERFKEEVVEEIEVTPDWGEVIIDSELSVATCPVKLEEDDCTVEEKEDPLFVDVKPVNTLESPSSNAESTSPSKDD